MKRRLFSIFLALALCLSLLPAAAFAEGEDWVQPDFAFYTAPTASEETLIAENSQVCYYTLPTLGTVWLIVSDGFEVGLEDIWIKNPNNSNDLTWGGNTAEVALSEPEDRFGYEISATYKDNPEPYTIQVSTVPPSRAAHFEHDGEEYVVGFSNGNLLDRDNGLAEKIPSAENGELVEWTRLYLDGFRLVNYDGYQVEAPTNGVDVAAKGFEIAHVYGDENALSFSPDKVELKTEAEEPMLYYREGAETAAMITAEITITVDGYSWDETVSTYAVLETYGLKFYSSADLSSSSYIENGDMGILFTDLPEKAVWLHSESPFDFDSLRVKILPYEGSTSDYEKWNKVDEHTIKIELEEPEAASGYAILVTNGDERAGLDILDENRAGVINVKVGNDEYAVGFVADWRDIIYIGASYSIGTSDTGPRPGAEPYSLKNLTVDVGLKREDASGDAYYIIEDNCPVEVRVTGWEIFQIRSDAGTAENLFSLTPDGTETKLEATSGNSTTAYVKLGYIATGLIVATVEVRVKGGETQTGKVGAYIHTDHASDFDGIYERPEDDTVEELNAAIAEVVNNLPDQSVGSTSIHFYLNAESYEGTIEIPESFKFKNNCYLSIASNNERVTLVGSVDLNGSGEVGVNGIDFIAPEDDGETKAIYDGSGYVSNCTFEGYDVAVDASQGVITGHRSVFVDNGIAVRIDNNPYSGLLSLANEWTENAFINNDTAVQVLRLNSSYYFRITDNNFVNNDTDFDIQHPGTFYFYRNYYGRVKKNVDDMTSAEILAALEKGSRDIQSQPPTSSIAEHSETKLVTNPRWKDPVALSGLPSLPTRSAGSGSAVPAVMSLTAAEEPLENYLTADWTLPTEIINGEAELEISAAAFAEASEVDRVISVVEIDAANETTTLLAEWNFGKAAYPDLTGSFDASVTVTEGENGAKTITLNANSELLAKLQPTLTIPEASGGVKHNGEGVASSSENGSVSFKVSGGGTYEISEDNPEIAPEPDTPSNPGTPVEPEEPEAEFTDVVPGAWYVDAVDYVVENGLMEGTSATTFEPDAQMTRAMFWTILARIDGETITGATWATDARGWAMASGVSDGTDPNGRITREQLVTMLWRYLGEPETTGTLAAFTDAGTVSDWADEAMAWAVSEGVIGGVTMTTLVPNGSATRAQCATILMRQA